MPGLGDEARAHGVQKLLRMLLGVGLVMMLVGVAALLARGLWMGAGATTTGLFVLALTLGAETAALFIFKDLSLLQLRALELLAFAAISTYLGVSTYLAVSAHVTLGQAGLAASHWEVVLVPVALLVVAYGTLIPNSPLRAATVIVTMILVPFAVVAAVRVAHPAAAGTIRDAIATVRIFESVTSLAVAAGIGVLAAYVIGQYFDAAFNSRVATMYSLKERIGVGGMGEVWLAEHNALARPAAVKLIKPEAVGNADGERARMLTRRFEREAKATASLRSVHTIDVYDFGVTNDGTFFYAMEHLVGLDLGSLVEAHGPLPPQRVVYLLSQVCESLAEAHRSGMTHRDIKPANIYVSRLGLAHDFVKVLDFGLVKTGAPAEAETKLTVEGVTTGTPAYMAPEMALNQSEVDGRADIYALGCVGYFLLTGKQVFEGDTPLSVIVEHVKTLPVPPSHKTELEIPADLERVIMRCLEKDPAVRYQSAEELATALLACRTTAPWDARRAADWWQLHLPQIAA